MATLTIPDSASEHEAAAIARKAIREQRKAERELSARREQSQHEANANAVRVFSWFHRGEKPDAVELFQIGENGACVNVDAETGAVTLMGGHGAAEFDLLCCNCQRVAETCAGVFAVQFYDRHTDRIGWCAIGTAGDVLTIVELPEAVGAWLFHS